MEYIKKTLDFQIDKPTVVTLGKFDGLHRGHEKLMKALFACSGEQGLSSVVFTFDMPPRNRIEDISNKVLTTNEEKEYIFESTGLEYLIECPFTEEVMAMDPKTFIGWICNRLNIKYMVVGEDFRFGYHRAGDSNTLIEYEEKYGYKTIVVDKMKDKDRDISSTYIREEVSSGRLEKANELLGYSYFIKNRVVHGNKLGRTIGIPTINMVLPEEKLLPPNGVYATRVYLDDFCYQGVTNVGYKPTVSEKGQMGVETFLLGFQGDVYGETMVVSFEKYLRPEKKFSSVEELKTQMEEDIAFVRKYYENIT